MSKRANFLQWGAGIGIIFLMTACNSAGISVGASTPLPPASTVLTTTPFPAALPTIDPTPLPTETRTPIPTEAMPECTSTVGQIIQTTLISDRAGEVRYRVYLPPCYQETERRYPLIIMLHGMGYEMDDAQWERMGLAHAADLGYARGALPPMIIVMPNGNDAEYDQDNGVLPAVIVDELLPEIESHFCTWNDSKHRAIGGLSRGGYWAFGIAFTYPYLFDKVGGHSAFFYEGDYTPFNPYNMVSTAEGIERLQMYLDHGVNDTLVDVNMQAFVSLLRARGINPDYVINPVGAHTEEYWSSRTADYLAFYATGWPREASEFPSCHAPTP